MLRLRLVFAVAFLTLVAQGQAPPCSELLSKAEQAYRDGSFEDIQSPQLCKCFGIYRSKKTGEIKPAVFKPMIDEIQNGYSMYALQLGQFAEHGDSTFVLSEDEFKSRNNNFFSMPERNRAFVLLGKLYDQLGVIRLSEYFALKAILIEPSNELINQRTGFTRTYSQEMGRVRDWSVGPILSWLYALPVAKTNNTGGVPDFRYQSDGKIGLGVQFNYFFKPTSVINIGLMISSTKMVYTIKRVPSNNDFDFFHTEKQNWVRLPVFFRWSSKNTLGLLKNTNGRPAVKIFFATGFSFDWMSGSRASIVDLTSNRGLYDYEVPRYRNRITFEYMLQGFARFVVGRNYLNVGVTGTWFLRDVVNQSLVGSDKNRLYALYGIKENNYKMVTGSWMVTYDFMFNRIKKRR